MSKPIHYFFHGKFMFAFNKVKFVCLEGNRCKIIFDYKCNVFLEGDEANDFILAYHIYLTELKGSNNA